MMSLSQNKIGFFSEKLSIFSQKTSLLIISSEAKPRYLEQGSGFKICRENKISNENSRLDATGMQKLFQNL